MNRELEKLLKEKWFLVAADLIAVIAILCVVPDGKRDGFDNFLILSAILLSSLIVVIPVLKDGGGKTERLAEQARLRAALAEEIDRQRDSNRSGTEALNRRIVEVELSAQKAAEVAAVAVAQRASAEVNALKASLAELEKKLQQAAQAAPSTEAVDDLAEKVDALATTVRAVVADADELATAAAKDQAEAKQAWEAELKSVRDDMKKAAKQAEKATSKLADEIEAVRGEGRPLPESLSVAAVPVAEKKAEEIVQPELTEDESEEEEPIEEIIEEEEAPVEAPPAAAASGTGTSLIINLMIGIGNKPYVRGTGPGLSPDKGVLMSFLGIGRWQWVSPDPEAPATVEVWKNDQSPMGEPLHLSGGEPVEVDEGHFGA
jgi:hypothetical protein